MQLLIVEDDPTLGDFLQRVVGEEGHTSELRTTAQAGLETAKRGSFDVIVLDWMLPDREGIAFCEDARKSGVMTPILMLTARGEVQDRVTGLRAGADDYLVKPFEVEELLARLDALVRRNARITELRVGDLVVERLERRVTLNDVVVELTAREYDLLARLAAAGGAPVTRADIFADVFQTQFDPGSGVLEVHVSRVREKLGADAWRIETVRGVGYRLRERKDP